MDRLALAITASFYISVPSLIEISLMGKALLTNMCHVAGIICKCYVMLWLGKAGLAQQNGKVIQTP